MNQYTITVSDGTTTVTKPVVARNHKDALVNAFEDEVAFTGLNEAVAWTITITQP